MEKVPFFSKLLLFICVFACLFLPGRMDAQTVSSITGAITDSSSAVIPNATVTITNDATRYTPLKQLVIDWHYRGFSA